MAGKGLERDKETKINEYYIQRELSVGSKMEGAPPMVRIAFPLSSYRVHSPLSKSSRWSMVN